MSSSLKDRLNHALYGRGISQATLAAILDVPRSSISNWLKNKSIPTNHLIKLALELNISVDWLIMGEGPEKLVGPQYVSLNEKYFIESIRAMGNDFTETYLKLLYQTIEPAYGKKPYESIGLSRFMDEAHITWGIISHDGRIIDASPGLFDLLKVEKDKPGELIGTSVFLWIAEEYISPAIVQFTRFLEGHEKNMQPQPFKCKVVTKKKEITPLLTMYYSYEIHKEEPKKNKIHIAVV